MAKNWLDDLNPAQREAATFGTGPLLVIAGAGTGKTKTLACRVAYLIDQGVKPERILLLTFTRRAAAEMISRAQKMCGAVEVGKVWSGTFHAVANRLLRIYGQALSLAPNFTVMDQGDSADLINLLRSELGVAKDKRRFPKKRTLIAIYSHTVNAQTPLRSVLDKYFPWCKEDWEGIKAVFEHYVQRKADHQLMDFDDLLLYWLALCDTQDVGGAIADRFEHVLVDEYQDTNVIQARTLRSMRKTYDSITVVGDDAQSIYSFRSATIRNILDFPEQFPGAQRVTLEKNYRSTQSILAAANAVMDQAVERYTKRLWSDRAAGSKPLLHHCLDETQQTEAVCRHILQHREQEIPLREQAVLFRAGHHSADLEIELSRRNIPFHKYGGLKFIEAAHIKDTLALLRILENPFDVISWFRVLQLLEAIGPKTARRIMNELGVDRRGVEPTRADGEKPLETPLRHLFRTPPRVPAVAGESFSRLRQALADCLGVVVRSEDPSPDATPTSSSEPPPVSVQLERIGRFLQPVIERVYDNCLVRQRDVEQLALIASRYRSRARFITDLTLDPPSATSDLAQPPHLDDDYLNLSTIHSAKGCEWTVVHIIHAADGMIPSDMAVGDSAGVEEERRLLYVAMTRAKDRLHLYFPLRYYHAKYRRGDGHGFAQLSRFLAETVRACFEERAVGQIADVDDTPDTPSISDAQGVRDSINRLWSD
ncbi:MAG: ATP-dependent helicase [Planctomycetes bacterium]|nr:ATP-dependent helicase [Planctomycetota bacterium]